MSSVDAQRCQEITWWTSWGCPGWNDLSWYSLSLEFLLEIGNQVEWEGVAALPDVDQVLQLVLLLNTSQLDVRFDESNHVS